MAPGGDLAADLLNRYQVDDTRDAGDPAADRADAGQPERSTPPELVESQR